MLSECKTRPDIPTAEVGSLPTVFFCLNFLNSLYTQISTVQGKPLFLAFSTYMIKLFMVDIGTSCPFCGALTRSSSKGAIGYPDFDSELMLSLNTAHIFFLNYSLFILT
jgi:hypothetical protein